MPSVQMQKWVARSGSGSACWSNQVTVEQAAAKPGDAHGLQGGRACRPAGAATNF